MKSLQERIKRFKQVSKADDFDFDDFRKMAEQDEDEEPLASLEVGKSLTYRMDHLDLDAWLKDLKQDLKQLNGIYLEAKDVTPDRDAKLAELKTDRRQSKEADHE